MPPIIYCVWVCVNKAAVVADNFFVMYKDF